VPVEEVDEEPEDAGETGAREAINGGSVVTGVGFRVQCGGVRGVTTGKHIGICRAGVGRVVSELVEAAGGEVDCSEFPLEGLPDPLGRPGLGFLPGPGL
jgi:hypothetical protein